ncbi:hypothetical protein HG549_19155 [Pseudomonas sp. SK]|uniref:hypothetical protein n=1 Tax=Pseudomonas sp. SK TaxID=2729423 RepID=UPI0014641968|nr:hypothetical protein [Pseudomonas sp. SK]QJQ21962.1 hypothetical protein HG549_19155 [Pseudomonas sp. SK]
MNIDQFQSGERRAGLWLAQVTRVLQRRLVVFIIQQPENQKTTRPFVELTDSAESFFRIVTELPAQTNCRPARQGGGLPQ